MNPASQAVLPGASPAADAILTVAQLNRRVAGLLESAIPRLWVVGEVSNFTRAASGHWYFSIKDESAAVRAVMFRGRAQQVGFTPKVGERFEFRVQVSLYEPRGDYQVQVEALRRAGRGDLHEAFLRLRDQLVAEGLIDAARRRAIAPFPKAVGVITSLSAAALRDVLSVMSRRAPHVPVIVYPAQVQGREAAEQLGRALDQAISRGEVDTLLLVRGGGSLEDLWCFNDEALARRIAGSPIPVISGVGHETDFTIADFVADLRAPTPTAAAELCCVARDQWLDQLRVLGGQIGRHEQRLLERAALRLDHAVAQLVSPQQRVRGWRERLQWGAQSLQAGALRTLAQRQARWQTAQSLLQALNPRQVLGRGYAIVRRSDGTIVQNALDLKLTERLDIEFGQGRARAEVTGTDA